MKQIGVLPRVLPALIASAALAFGLGVAPTALAAGPDTPPGGTVVSSTHTGTITGTLKRLSVSEDPGNDHGNCNGTGDQGTDHGNQNGDGDDCNAPEAPYTFVLVGGLLAATVLVPKRRSRQVIA